MPPNGFDSPTLLLVEDNAIIALTTAQILKSNGYQVRIANSGDDAVEQVRACPDIHLVLMDINLGAGTDGTEAAQCILQERDIPVVFLSGHTEPEVVEKTEKITSYGYVVKGSNSTVLLASIKMAFKLHEANQRLKEREHRLELSEKRFRALFENSRDAVALLHADGSVLYASPNLTRLTGYTPGERLGQDELESVYLEDQALVKSTFVRLVQQPGSIETVQFRAKRKDGTFWWVEATASNMLHEPDVSAVVVNYRDITRRKQAEAALRESEAYFRLVWAESPIAKELYNAQGQLIDANRACLALFGVQRLEDVRGFCLFEDPNINPDVKTRLQAGETFHYESLFDFDKVHQNNLYPTHKTGRIQISVQVTPLCSNGVISGYLVQVQDITQHKLAEAALESALDEKSMLLKDLQHRIKNSLALIASLIALGKNNASGEEAKDALEELYSRVIALSGLYEMLYGAKDDHTVCLDDYLRQVAESLAASYMHREKGIDLAINCEQIRTDARQATPLGLILNELLTNALKYGFSNGEGGTIRVLLRRLDPRQVELVVSNTGLLPAGFDLHHSSGLGLQIVQMLVGQLQGTITCQSNGLTAFTVQVPLEQGSLASP